MWNDVKNNEWRYVQLERRGQIVQLTLHTDGKPFEFGAKQHDELGHVFARVGRDEQTKVVVITGTGDSFCAEFDWSSIPAEHTVETWDRVYREGKDLVMNLLGIEVPVIAAVNGPALVHAEIALLSDIVLCAEHAAFQDAPHFLNGIVPGDGAHVMWPLLLGTNRGRYFLLTGQKIAAPDALSLGLVSEVLPKEDLLRRTWELAEQLAAKPRLVLRYTRLATIQHVKRLMLDELGYGLALEGLAFLSRGQTQG